MTAEKEYLIYLISCFLNGDIPEGREVNWKELYRSADINDICGIIGNEIKLLKEDFLPESKIKSALTQQLGYAVRDYEFRIGVLSEIKSVFNEIKTDFLIVKGSAISSYYPIKELRTSGDIDIIVRCEEYERLVSFFENKCSSEKDKYSGYIHKNDTVMFYLSDVLIEIHKGADLQNDYFNDIFDVAIKENDYEYSLSLFDNLMYVFLHLVKHIADRGAGIRMLMDLDVLIRNIENFSEEKFYAECEKAGELKYAQILLSVLSKAFKTPVRDVIGIDNNSYYDNMIDIMLDGGSFGYFVQSTGFYHYYVNNDTDKEVKGLSKFKAIVRYVFPRLEYVRGYREYSVKHPVLTPLAYFARAKDALFKRRKKALNTFSQIIRVNDNDIDQRKFLEQIDIDSDKRRN